MPEPETGPPRERLYQALYEVSLRRLKRRGLSEDTATRIAGEVARRAAERTRAPDFSSEQKLAGTVLSVCKALAEGRSYYDVMGERPYLVSGRIDRLVAAGRHVRPQVPAEIELAARRAAALERLSGGLALMFTAAALAVLGIWEALIAGVLVSAGSELYVQAGMPPAVRRSVAHYRVPHWLGIVSLAMLVYVSFSWLSKMEHPLIGGCGLLLFAPFVASVVPGFALVLMVGLRERRWREALERELTQREPGSPES